MIKNYLNKDALITIAFAYYTIDGGTAPLSIIGKVTNFDDVYASIEFDPKQKENKSYLKITSGKMIVKKEYIISIILL